MQSHGGDGGSIAYTHTHMHMHHTQIEMRRPIPWGMSTLASPSPLTKHPRMEDFSSRTPEVTCIHLGQLFLFLAICTSARDKNTLGRVSGLVLSGLHQGWTSTWIWWTQRTAPKFWPHISQQTRGLTWNRSGPEEKKIYIIRISQYQGWSLGALFPQLWCKRRRQASWWLKVWRQL